jgi:hypothetical protein
MWRRQAVRYFYSCRPPFPRSKSSERKERESFRYFVTRARPCERITPEAVTQRRNIAQLLLCYATSLGAVCCLCRPLPARCCCSCCCLTASC